MSKIPKQTGQQVAEEWVVWCGENTWTKNIRRFGELGGLVQWWCGYPQSASAIPLCFSLLKPDGTEIEGNSRLKDIKTAIKELERNP